MAPTYRHLTSFSAEREPFVVTFKALGGNFNFTLISIHVLWGKSVLTRRQELTHFADVIQAVLAQNKGERDVYVRWSTLPWPFVFL